MLEITNLHATVNGREILKGLNLTVRAGEVHSIMGPNGSGKSTLAQVLAGRETYQITRGEILYLGKNLAEMSPEELQTYYETIYQEVFAPARQPRFPRWQR